MIVSPDLFKNRDSGFDPEGMVNGEPTAIVTSSVPDPDPPAVNLMIFSSIVVPSTAETEYVVLSLGVVTDPPKLIGDPLMLTTEFTKALFGMLVIVFKLPEIVQVSNVLLVTVCVAVK